MRQIKVELFLVALEIHLDFLLPLDRPVCSFLEEMVAQIEDMEPSICFDSTQPYLLCDLERRLLLDSQKSLSELGVSNGARLSLC